MTTSKKIGTSWTNSSVSNKIINSIGTGFGIGYFTKFSESLGSFLGLGAFFATRHLDVGLQGVLFMGFSFLAIGVSEKIERMEKSKNPNHIIIDEFIGMWTSMLFIWNINFYTVVVAFLLFRFFDTLKPFPLNIFQGFSGGVGIVADDIAAGMLSNFILRLLLLQGVFG